MDNLQPLQSSLPPVLIRKNLNSLSVEVYHFYIFSNLHINDVWNLRLVNKRLYSYVKSYNIYELSVITHDYHHHFCYFYKYRDNWISTTRPIKLRNQIHVYQKSPLRIPSSNLANLKYLRMSFAENLFKMEELEKFTKLQILEIFYIYLHKDHHLKLPNLKALFIGNFKSRKHAHFSFNAPNLHSISLLKYESNEIIDSKIKFSHPLAVKNLKIRFYEHNVTKFVNLECFELYYSREAVRLELGDPVKFRRLKKFKISSVLFSQTLNQLKELFMLKKPDLVIVLEGVRINELNKIDEHKPMRARLKFQMENYADLEDNLNFVTTMNYNDLVALVPDKQPADLFKKFNNIQTLEITGEIEDEDRLLNFIKRCNNLFNLKIKKSSLSQEFYNRLPENSSLAYLDVIYSNNFNLSFEFILEMPWLSNFYTNLDVRLGENLNINKLKLLKRFEFHIVRDKLPFMITRSSYDRYKIQNYSELEIPDKKFNFNELCRWYHFKKWSNHLVLRN